MDFADAYKMDIAEHTEKKGKFTYLSWAFAVRFLRENFPEATWSVKHFDEVPYKSSIAGCFVEVTVVHGGNPFTQIHPILNFQNKVVMEPDAFMVNTSIQRCLAKAIAIATGIGLSLYSGEDIPVEEKKAPVDRYKFEEAIDWFVGKIKDKEKTVEDFKKWFKSKGGEIDTLNDNDKAVVNNCYLENIEMVSPSKSKNKMEIDI